MKKTIFITGGHYTPAKAVMTELEKNPTEWEIYYVGRKFALEGDKGISLEYQEVSKDKKSCFLEITTGRPQRKFTKRSVPSLLKIPIGFVQSLYWILKYRPKLILSFGGYVAIPIATVGWLFGIHIINHEQVPAFDYPSKYLNLLATKVLVSFKHLLPHQENNKWLYTGNPVRSEIFDINLTPELLKLGKIKKTTKDQLIYITGGNQGSHIVNACIFDSLEEILSNNLLIWQTGDSQQFKDFDKAQERISSLSQKLRERVLVKKFFFAAEIGAIFSLTDVVIGRSGANTVSELAAVAKPAILIPIPWVHDKEQEKNAQVLVTAGSAILLEQDKLSPATLLNEISNLQKNYSKYLAKAVGNKTSSGLEAVKKIVSEVEKVAYQN